jgi:endonuclease/exonuclease/phosphatase family metal-dependent hydrolase
MKKLNFKAIQALAIVFFMIAPSHVMAKRMISGVIIMPTGVPAVGYKVKAYDEDDVTGGSDDKMGKTVTTDAQGRFKIGRYAGKDWDTQFPGSLSWRPDIYIKVYAVINGHEVAIGKSKTFEDHRMSDDLIINLELKVIKGAIKDRLGAPVTGVLVKAFDDDDLSGDDFMNQIYPDANGLYMMPYEQKYECEYIYTKASCWDTPVPGSVSWRPDICIEVHGMVRGRQIKINNRSTIISDVPHRDNVNISVNTPILIDINYVVQNSGLTGNELNVLAYNVYLRPPSIVKNGQAIRVPYIVKEILRDYYDVIILNEVFEDGLRRQLREALDHVYPYHSVVPGSNNEALEDGGVEMLSRWPIENGQDLKGEAQVFGPPCLGSDCLANKGVVYIRINKNGTRYHVFGTHLQADELPSALITSREIRNIQFHKIKEFIDSKNIPSGEAVIIAGDLNVDKYGGINEYNEMLEILHAAHPSIEGHPWSIDMKLNDFYDYENIHQLLDYVLYSKDHRQPVMLGEGQTVKNTFNRVMFYRSDIKWREFPTERYRWDISDHYPVFGKFTFPTPR